MPSLIQFVLLLNFTKRAFSVLDIHMISVKSTSQNVQISNWILEVEPHTEFEVQLITNINLLPATKSGVFVSFSKVIGEKGDSCNDHRTTQAIPVSISNSSMSALLHFKVITERFSK